MKIVINKCYGGYGLSPKAIKRLAELKGKECYFFKHDFKEDIYIPLTIEEAKESFSFAAFSIPNPKEYLRSHKSWHEMTLDKRKENNRRYEEVNLDSRFEDRVDKDLIKVVEELGKEADGDCAELKIVEIPDGTEWVIEEYDGVEWVAEKHRTWR